MNQRYGLIYTYMYVTLLQYQQQYQ